jgi:hypothetical protein
MMTYRHLLRLWRSNYGRKGGWLVEREGVPIAVLTDCRMYEMFWDSYRIEITTDDPQLQQQLLTPEFWIAETNLTWRSRAFGEVAPHAFSALTPFPEPGRLLMRGLYLYCRSPYWWDNLILWFTRRS